MALTVHQTYLTQNDATVPAVPSLPQGLMAPLRGLRQPLSHGLCPKLEPARG